MEEKHEMETMKNWIVGMELLLRNGPPAYNPPIQKEKKVDWIQLIAAFHLGRNQWINQI